MKRLFILFFSISVHSCTTNETNSFEEAPQLPPEETSILNETTEQWTFETFMNNDETWGYQILNEGKLYINQPSVPAVQGNKGFKSNEAASKTAEFVILKLELGVMPPSVTIQELDSLNVMN